MLEAIKNIALGIWETLVTLVSGITSLVEYVVTLVKDIAWISRYIGGLMTGGIFRWFTWLPSVCLTLILACIGIAVVYKIMGRE